MNFKQFALNYKRSFSSSEIYILIYIILASLLIQLGLSVFQLKPAINLWENTIILIIIYLLLLSLRQTNILKEQRRKLFLYFAENHSILAELVYIQPSVTDEYGSYQGYIKINGKLVCEQCKKEHTKKVHIYHFDGDDFFGQAFQCECGNLLSISAKRKKNR